MLWVFLRIAAFAVGVLGLLLGVFTVLHAASFRNLWEAVSAFANGSAFIFFSIRGRASRSTEDAARERRDPVDTSR